MEAKIKKPLRYFAEVQHEDDSAIERDSTSQPHKSSEEKIKRDSVHVVGIRVRYTFIDGIPTEVDFISEAAIEC